MYPSEKRSLYRFLAIYLLSTLILFSAGAYIFYAYERHHLMDRQREALKNEGERMQHELMLLQKNFNRRLPYPAKDPYESAIFDIDQKLIFSTFPVNCSIDFSREYSIDQGRIIHIKPVDPYYLGAAYLLVWLPIDREGLHHLQRTIILFMLLAGLVFLIMGYFLGRLFVAPMRDSIEKMNSFIQDTTHELNTPISTILANLELMDTLHKCEAKEEMDRIEIASKTLSRIYNDLTYLKLNNNYHRDIKPLNLSELLYERIRYFSTAINSKGIVLSEQIEEAFTLPIDRDDAMRLIDNLISNAIKYNKRGGSMELVLDSEGFSVKDSGIGIAKKDLDTLFERFVRANESEGGFGIGLHIVHRIAQTYHFEITIESQPEVGTEVVIRWEK